MSSSQQQLTEQSNPPQKKSQISRKHIRKSRFVLPSQSKNPQSSTAKNSKPTISSIRHTSKDFICPICLQMICCSATLKCGHAFCESCLIEFSLLFNTCLVCNDSILNQQYRNCFLLDNLIEEYIKVHFHDELQTFLTRKEESLKSRQLRGITNPAIGQKVDVRDTHNIWCQGIISRLSHDNQQVVQAMTIAFLSGTHVQEEIPVDSARLAPEGVFTNRLDIPHYESLKSDARVVIVKADKTGKQITYYVA